MGKTNGTTPDKVATNEDAKTHHSKFSVSNISLYTESSSLSTISDPTNNLVVASLPGLKNLPINEQILACERAASECLAYAAFLKENMRKQTSNNNGEGCNVETGDYTNAIEDDAKQMEEKDNNDDAVSDNVPRSVNSHL